MIKIGICVAVYVVILAILVVKFWNEFEDHERQFGMITIDLFSIFMLTFAFTVAMRKLIVG